jgi:hypothetical protein
LTTLKYTQLLETEVEDLRTFTGKSSSPKEGQTVEMEAEADMSS